MEIAVMALAAALIKKAVDLVRQVKATEWSDVATTVVAAAAGIGTAFLLGASDFAAGISWDGVTLATMAPATKALFGLGLASTAGVLTDVVKAVDGTQSARVPSMIRPEGPP